MRWGILGCGQGRGNRVPTTPRTKTYPQSQHHKTVSGYIFMIFVIELLEFGFWKLLLAFGYWNLIAFISPYLQISSINLWE
jgi:hypothetical protein